MPSASKAGNSFECEADLVSCGAALLPAFISSRASHWKIASELAVGSAIADLAVALFNRPLNAKVAALSARDSVVLSSLRNRGMMRVDLLEERCGLARGGIRGPGLNRLVADGLVTRRPGGCLALSGGWTEGVELIAIEAKLFDWRQALRQAAAYGRYADSVYVMLPPAEGRREACTIAAAKAGIGIFLVERDRIIEHIVPARRVDHDWRREYALSRILAKR